MKPTMRVMLRRDLITGEPGLFFYTEGPGYKQLTCYFHVGQHSQCSPGYLHDHTKPANKTEPDVHALLREWTRIPPECEVHIVSRIRDL